MKKKNVKETLADRIAGILSAAPSSFDPEEDTNEETSAKVIENEQPDDSEEDELLLSKFRKQNVELLEDVDQRYAGRKGSRRNLKDSEDEDLSDDDDNDTGANDDELSDNDGDSSEVNDDDESEDDFEEKFGKVSFDKNKQKTKKEESSEDEENSEMSEGDDDNEMDEEDDDNEFNSESEEEANFKHLKDTDPSGVLKKGICVKNQLNLWESLLEMRIQVQKCLITANKMPQCDTYKSFNEHPEFQRTSNETKKSVGNVLDKLLELQNVLVRKYPETKGLLKKGGEAKQKIEDDDEEIPSDTDEELNAEQSDDEEIASPKKKLKLSEYEKVIDDMHGKYKTFRNSTIQKWNDKTRIATGKSTTAHSVINQIEHNLRDRERLIKRTQIKRSEYKILGAVEKEPVDPENAPRFVEETNNEIYDDDDFYHQLLRELIEVKSADLTDPVQLGRQWIQLQNLRSKMKRKVDTKATKGRKIRYAVHTKLVNFMAPIDENHYTDEAKTELFNSLFGKMQAVDG